MVYVIESSFEDNEKFLVINFCVIGGVVREFWWKLWICWKEKWRERIVVIESSFDERWIKNSWYESG